MEPILPIFSKDIGSFTFNLTTSIVIEWIVILILGIGAFLLTKNLKLKPSKTQSALEKIYQSIRDLVVNIMGEEYESFLPYIGTLMIYLLILNFTGLIGIEPPTADLSVTVSFAIVTFLVVNLNAIKRNGLLGYGKGLVHPFAFMLPINIMERFVLLVSLSLRLFGNMVAAVVLVKLVYSALGSMGMLAQFGSPIFVHLYFDLFDGAIQMIVFAMLTMINIKVIGEH
ncbi:ATP synthase subunit a [Clostridium gelidum]|uniref:ATP synthase subunit a n=1 Tax=Clostridium gelidum TaxID=704125 RepID=A0ABM7SY36_9CLOT|nr:F0F1 ATP synthase subunit A [Clostridium gelidum]BCZ44505.1 ATP synthase subunit a [Clostridium gelidum]